MCAAELFHRRCLESFDPKIVSNEITLDGFIRLASEYPDFMITEWLNEKDEITASRYRSWFVGFRTGLSYSNKFKRRITKDATPSQIIEMIKDYYSDISESFDGMYV